MSISNISKILGASALMLAFAQPAMAATLFGQNVVTARLYIECHNNYNCSVAYETTSGPRYFGGLAPFPVSKDTINGILKTHNVKSFCSSLGEKAIAHLGKQLPKQRNKTIIVVPANDGMISIHGIVAPGFTSNYTCQPLKFSY